MKKCLFVLLVVFGFNGTVSAQSSVGLKADARHFVSLVLDNILFFSLENNENSDIAAQKELIVNSNIPMNITVKETTGETFYTYIPELPVETHGPAITQIRSVFKVHYYTDHDPHYTTSLLYTAAPM